MKVLGLVFLALIATSFCDDDEFPLEKDVMILTDSTFDKAVEKYEYLLVLFYAPWCGHCKKFHPEYEKAATVLRKEKLYLAKVDATVEKKLAEKFEIQGFPTVKLFVKGEPIEYTGGRKESEVINWMRKKSGPATKDLKTAEEVEKTVNGSLNNYIKSFSINIKHFNNFRRENDIYESEVFRS